MLMFTEIAWLVGWRGTHKLRGAMTLLESSKCP
jgi:hypothetical protein